MQGNEPVLLLSIYILLYMHKLLMQFNFPRLNNTYIPWEKVSQTH